MRQTLRRSAPVFAACALVAGASLAVTSAEAATSTPPSAAAYQDECGSCHTAYPARFLEPADWARVLANLDKHYGTDATLDAAARTAVGRHLGANADLVGATSSTPLPRITRSHWFLDEHDEIPAANFRSPAVRSAANCAACHTGADRGNFDEHAVRIPK